MSGSVSRLEITATVPEGLAIGALVQLGAGGWEEADPDTAPAAPFFGLVAQLAGTCATLVLAGSVPHDGAPGTRYYVGAGALVTSPAETGYDAPIAWQVSTTLLVFAPWLVIWYGDKTYKPKDVTACDGGEEITVQVIESTELEEEEEE
jgi:hypothetical protein